MPIRPERFPILNARPAHDLINRLSHARKELGEMRLTQEQKQDLDHRVDVEFAIATLRVEGTAVSRDRVESLFSSNATATNAQPELRNAIVSALDAIGAVRSLADVSGPAAALTPELLIRLYAGYDSPARPPVPVAEQAIAEAAAATRFAKLQSACHWFTAESFDELHPAEQSSIVLMRLLELAAFEEGNTRTALAASSLFTLRSGLPPIIIRPEMEAAYKAALNDGMRMNTKPMVDLVTDALLRTVNEMIQRARKNNETG